MRKSPLWGHLHALTRLDHLASLALRAVLMPMPTQMHDELVFEVQEGALPALAAMVKRVLEGEAAGVALAVPLPVKVNVGLSWGELKEYNAT